MNFKSLVLGLAAAVSLVSSAKALVMNGDFTLSSYPSGTPYEDIVNIPRQIKNWTVSGYGSTSGSWNAVYINDPNPGFSNPLSSPPMYMPAAYRTCMLGFQSGASCHDPNGPGYFVNLDGDPDRPAAISQTISSGLHKGDEYRLTFSWADVQRSDKSGPTSDEYLTASLGDQ